LTAPRLAEFAALDDAGFRALFAGTSIRRTGRDRFLRNVLIAIGNAPTARPELVEAARRCLDDPVPLVRGAAVWAFGRISGRAEVATEATARRPTETDPDVRAEWQRLLEPAAFA
jgi:epoxyqueuosine reductase